MDPTTHRRYLDYREKHGYFGRGRAMLGAAEFVALERELAELQSKGDAREDEEEARVAELLAILLQD